MFARAPSAGVDKTSRGSAGASKPAKAAAGNARAAGPGPLYWDYVFRTAASGAAASGGGGGGGPAVRVSQPSDSAEIEADRAADRVMRMASSQALSAPREVGSIQRKCAKCDEEAGTIRRKCAKCDAEEQIHRKAAEGAAESAPASPANSAAPSHTGGLPSAFVGAGQPLDAATRAFMEPRFGANFGAVRVHVGGEAARSARQFDALAYSVGNHIVFGESSYAPDTDSGKRLIAHELAHTLQPWAGVVHRQRACVLKEDIPTNRSGIINKDGQVGEKFEAHIQWDDTPNPLERAKSIDYCDASCGEYRQYVRGYIVINGRKDTTKVWSGVEVHETEWHEDGLDHNPAARYGHRDEKQTMNEDYLPGRVRGDRYVGRDFPRVMIGDEVEIHDEFKGQSYDKCTDKFGPIHTWKVEFKGKINRPNFNPTPNTAPGPDGGAGPAAPKGEAAEAPRLETPTRLPQPKGAAPLDAAERQADDLGGRLGEALPGASLEQGPLPARVASVAEQHLGVSMAGVDLRADDPARALTAKESAHAVTKGTTVSFARGIPAMGASVGRALLGHELVHVAQQRVHGEKAVQKKPVKGLPLAQKIKSVDLKQLSKPKIVRQNRPGGSTLDLLMTNPLEVEATAQFASAADASGLTFGFFQLGRPYELYRATMRQMGANPGDTGKDLNLDLTSQLRSKLPLQDHADQFFGGSGAVDGTGKVTIKYSDQITTPFPKEIQKGNDFFGLSGIAAQSFLFTGFGAWDGTDVIMLKTFYWDMKHCEPLTPQDIPQTKVFGSINVDPFRSCQTGGCDLGEPGADKWGGKASPTYLGWVGSVVVPALPAVGSYAGPSDFSVGCNAPKGRVMPRGRNE